MELILILALIAWVGVGAMVVWAWIIDGPGVDPHTYGDPGVDPHDDPSIDE